MKFKYFLTLPLVALLASCNSAPSAAAKVKQSLPKDETAISNKDEQYQEILPVVTNGLLTFNSLSALYHVKVDVDVSAKIRAQLEEGKITKLSEKVSAHGEAYFGFDSVTYEGVDFVGSRAYLGVKDLSLTVDVNIPVVTEETSESGESTTEYSVENYKLNLKNIYFSLLAADTPDGAILIGDFSSASLQELLSTALTAYVELPEAIDVEQILDAILGERQKDASGEYIPYSRSGKVVANLTSVLTVVNNALIDPENPEDKGPIPAAYISSPVTALYSLLVMATGMIPAETITTITALLTALNVQLGAKFNEDGKVVKASAVLNTTVKEIAEKFINEEEQGTLPVSGNLGLLLTVGTETGASSIALEELVVAAELKVNIEEMVSASLSAKLALDAVYGEQVQLPFPTSEEIAEYKDITTELTGIVMLIIYLSQSEEALG